MFIHVSKNEDWLLEAATGKIERHALKRSRILDLLREALKQTPAGPGEAAGADEAAVAANVAHDPMAMMDEIDSAHPGAKVKKFKGKKVERSKRGNNMVRLLDMPAKEPNKHPESMSRRQVMVLPTSTSALWLRKEDLAWFLEYLSDEVGPDGTQGVAQIEDCGDDDEQPNCEAQDVYMNGISKAS